MRPTTFLLSSVLFALLLGVFYVVVVLRLVLLEQSLPTPYSQFLLEASADVSGKVVIESGSNSQHGIAVEQLATGLRRPVVVVSDSGSFPLRKKYFRLERTLNRGDVLLLPLEWDYYSRPPQLADNFLEKIAAPGLVVEHYYADLPALEKLRFILREYPVRHVFEALFVQRNPDPQNKWALTRLQQFEDRFRQGGSSAYGAQERDGPEKINFIAAWSGGCDRYLFWREEQFLLEVSDTFRDNLQLLRRLQARGVRIHFLWPAVVDSEKSDCYNNAELAQRLDDYAADIRRAVEAEGMSFLGSYRDSHFPRECFLNTYYHLRYSCARDRTSRLLGLLQAQEPLSPVRGMDNAEFSAVVTAKIAALRRELARAP